MPGSYKPTPKQLEALRVIGGEAKHCMLFGGSRSGKTFIGCRAVALRALAAHRSRHAILRFRFNHVKASVVLDTFPKMMELCFPEVDYDIDKTDWYARFTNDSQIWFGGLDDKERTEKILGQEHATLYFNECSQIPFTSRNLALTRLAQRATHAVGGEEKQLRLKALYDCNPPSQAHWSYKVFIQGKDPETGEPIRNKGDYVSLLMNPGDNAANLPPDYLATLQALPARMRLRFLEGKFADASEGALWALETIERWRQVEIPDMQRIVVAVDPSGAADTDNASNDAIGIVVAGLGTDGNGYLLEDLTLKAGPQAWGNVATTAFDRHDADLIVAEKNYGGEMVRYVINSQPKVNNRTRPCRVVTASRGKAVRAEPISALHEQGKIRFAGNFPELEDELCSFTTSGYIGTNSPNRADAMIWAFSELFPGLVKETKPKKEARGESYGQHGPQGWMAG
jgi:phage terminase large subunit-like protein